MTDTEYKETSANNANNTNNANNNANKNPPTNEELDILFDYFRETIDSEKIKKINTQKWSDMSEEEINVMIL